MPNPWEEFRVGTPSAKANWTEPDCQPLQTVSHVAHVSTAVRIAQDKRIRPDLVFDESKLKSERIRVVWLSPNHWTLGYRYGNVRFVLEWSSLIAGKNYYWVEKIDYGIPACRILVTQEDRGASLQPYNPRVGDGPWWLAPDGTHYWNGKITLEIMLEADVPTTDAIRVDFVKHHTTFCNESRPCTEQGWDWNRGGAAFLARLAYGQDLRELRGLAFDDNGTTRPSPHVLGAVSYLMQKCATLPTGGSLTSELPAAPAIARAVVTALAVGPTEDAKKLASLFSDTSQLRASVAAVFGEALNTLPAEFLEEPSF